MSVQMSLLAMLSERPMYGLELKNGFEERTGSVWPLNVGQVYTTLGRLERDGHVTLHSEAGGNKEYAITPEGRALLDDWFVHPVHSEAPPRDELVLKLLLASSNPSINVTRVIQAERRAVLEQLQGYTRLKTGVPRMDDLGWMMLLDSLIYKAEARVRWLDVCEARIAQHPSLRGSSRDAGRRTQQADVDHPETTTEEDREVVE
ncbi:MAG: PadR family transcriptional regulator [Acidobacteria bacterium]|nr:PadR family transcriptional regulator [Acidobacteriota bacterium]